VAICSWGAEWGDSLSGVLWDKEEMVSTHSAKRKRAIFIDGSIIQHSQKNAIVKMGKIFEVVGMQSGSGFANIWFFELACEKEKECVGKKIRSGLCGGIMESGLSLFQIAFGLSACATGGRVKRVVIKF
jgi:hypothetical protein